MMNEKRMNKFCDRKSFGQDFNWNPMSQSLNEIMSPSRIEEEGMCRNADLKSWSRQLSMLHGYCNRIP
ncbi:MAG: hypothetical protein QMC80_07815 [Thermoplasmatales archaeon]|nr:hypothetical protein [Thermoplasmatales archaeon]